MNILNNTSRNKHSLITNNLFYIQEAPKPVQISHKKQTNSVSHRSKTNFWHTFVFSGQKW